MKKEEIPDILSDWICKDAVGMLSSVEQEKLEEMCRYYGITQEERDRMLSRLSEEERFGHQEAFRAFERRTMRRIYLRHLRIAVSIVLAVGCGMLVWWLNMPEPMEKVEIVHTIQPSSNKAVITLSDGRQVVLEKQDQHLEELDGTRIESSDGELKYSDSLHGNELIYNRISIPRGAEFKLVLADGTKVWLNAETELKYPVAFGAGQREVFLCGEAYFEVAPDRTKPFYVATSKGKIQVLGTSFNVRDYRDEAKVVTVLETGKVRYLSAYGKGVDLQPGYMLEDRDGEALMPRKVDTKFYTAWREGKYFFENASVEEIMSNLQRWYNIQVIYADESIKKLHFTGDLEKYAQFDTILKFLETCGDIRIQINGNTLIVNKK